MGITCDNIYKVLTFESENVSRSVVSNSLRPHGQRSPVGFSPWGFSRQEYWSGLPCCPPGDLPDPGIEPESLMSPELAGGFFTTSVPAGKLLQGN